MWTTTIHWVTKTHQQPVFIIHHPITPADVKRGVIILPTQTSCTIIFGKSLKFTIHLHQVWSPPNKSLNDPCKKSCWTWFLQVEWVPLNDPCKTRFPTGENPRWCSTNDERLVAPHLPKLNERLSSEQIRRRHAQLAVLSNHPCAARVLLWSWTKNPQKWWENSPKGFVRYLKWRGFLNLIFGYFRGG